MFNFKLLVSALLLVSIDSIYLKFIKNYFANQIKAVQGSPMKINYLAAIICYIFIIMGFNYFIIKGHRSVSDAFLLGLVTYGIYETTNKALFTNWSWTTVIIDTLWGGTLFAIVAYLLNLI